MALIGRIVAVTGVVVAAAVVAAGFRILNTAGVFIEVKPGFDGTCRTITGIAGAEDIAIDEKAGLAFISATDRRAPKGEPNPQDGLYTLVLAHPENGVAKLAGTPKDFHPHGISLYRGADGALTLMAVNHRKAGGSSIDIFVVHEMANAGGAQSPTLVETASVQSSLIMEPNDVAAVGPNSFYVTNSSTSTTTSGALLEVWLQLPRANIVYYDGQMARVVAKDLRYANGIALSADGSKLYVAETLGRDVVTYDRQPASGALAEKTRVALPAGLDNIDVDAKGDLWVAGHPKLFAFTAYGSDPSKPSPSQIFELTVAYGTPAAPRAVYTDLGKEIGASSVGAYANGTLLIGSVFDPKILDCTPRTSE